MPPTMPPLQHELPIMNVIIAPNIEKTVRLMRADDRAVTKIFKQKYCTI